MSYELSISSIALCWCVDNLGSSLIVSFEDVVCLFVIHEDCETSLLCSK